MRHNQGVTFWGKEINLLGAWVGIGVEYRYRYIERFVWSSGYIKKRKMSKKKRMC